METLFICSVIAFISVVIFGVIFLFCTEVVCSFILVYTIIAEIVKNIYKYFNKSNIHKKNRVKTSLQYLYVLQI